MRILKQQDGIALVTSLVLTMLSLAMIMVLMSFVIQGIRTSGFTKRYANSLEASYGGAELITKELIPSFFNFRTTTGDAIAAMQAKYGPANINLQIANADTCLNQKLNNVTSLWTSDACGAERTNPDPKTNPDMQFTLRSNLAGFNNQAGYSVYAKIIDTAVAGNTYKSRADFDIKSPGADRDGSSPAAIPSLYTIEITADPESNLQNTLGRARIEVLYSY